MNLRRAIAVWLLIVVAESISGTIRQLCIAPAIGERSSHQIGVLIGSALILLIAWLTARWLNAQTLKAQLQVGALWVVLIVAFELSLGAALGYSRARITADYDLSQGGLMGLGLLVMLVAPALGARMTKVHKQTLGK
jgi:hypothetical protein